MPAHLARLVGKAEKEVAQFIAEMEGKLLYPSADVRLLDEINRTARQKISDLDLDPLDTTAEELYHALGARFDSDSKMIDRALGLSSEMRLGQRIGRAMQFVQAVHGKDRVWVLKSIVAKQLLRTLPPRKTMARLNYRSLESLLKREDPAKILLCAQYLESAVWQKSLSLRVSRLSASSYEQKPVTFLTLENIGNGGPSDGVATSKLGGALAIWPNNRLKNASGLHLILGLLRGLNKLEVRAGPKTIAHGHPLLNWWSSAGHLLSLYGDRPVSFNLQDVATNHLHGHAYPDAVFRHGAKSLWAELQASYEKLGGEILTKIEGPVEDNKARKLTVPTPAQLAEDLVSV